MSIFKSTLVFAAGLLSGVTLLLFVQGATRIDWRNEKEQYKADYMDESEGNR